MTKRPSRESVRETIGLSLPEETQQVPKKPKSKAEAKRQLQRWGKPKTYRLPPELIEAITMAAHEKGIPARDLVEFLLRSGLFLLASDRLKMKIEEDADKPVNRIAAEGYPEIPSSYQTSA